MPRHPSPPQGKASQANATHRSLRVPAAKCCTSPRRQSWKWTISTRGQSASAALFWREGKRGEGRGGGCVRSDEGWRHKARAAWSPPSTAGGRSVDPTQRRDPVPTCAPVPPPTTPTRGPPRARGTPLCHLYPTPETPHGRRNAPVLVVAQGRRRVQLLHLHGRGGCGGRHPCARPW